MEDITKSAKKGDKEAQYNLGVMYYDGLGVPKMINRLFIGIPNLRSKALRRRRIILV